MVWGSGFRVKSFSIVVKGLGVEDLRLRAWGMGFRVQGVGFEVKGLEFKV
jgi:hypothetical protein